MRCNTYIVRLNSSLKKNEPLFYGWHVQNKTEHEFFASSIGHMIEMMNYDGYALTAILGSTYYFTKWLND